jgi:hypothetical protein
MDPVTRLAPLFNNPGFWTGVLAVREADLEAASEAPSGVGSWLQEAAARAKTLLEASQAGIDVTTLPEFERWLGPRAVFHEPVPVPETELESLDIIGPSR